MHRVSWEDRIRCKTWVSASLKLSSEILFRGTSMNLVFGCTWSPVLEKYMYFDYGIMEGGGNGRCGV